MYVSVSRCIFHYSKVGDCRNSKDSCIEATCDALILLFDVTLLWYTNLSNFDNLLLCRNEICTVTHSHTRQIERIRHESYNVISATKTERYSHSHTHETHYSHTHANYNTKIARRLITGMFYAVLTTLYDTADSERISREFTAHVVAIRKSVTTRFATRRISERQTVPYRFMPTLRSSSKSQ